MTTIKNDTDAVSYGQFVTSPVEGWGRGSDAAVKKVEELLEAEEIAPSCGPQFEYLHFGAGYKAVMASIKDLLGRIKQKDWEG